MTVHDAIPKERGLSVSFTFYVKTPLRRGLCYSNSGERMNDCPRRYTKRTRLIGQFHLLRKNPAPAGFLLFE